MRNVDAIGKLTLLLNDYKTDNRCKLWGYEAACSCEQPKNRLQIDEIKVVACCGDLKTDPSKVHVLWDLHRLVLYSVNPRPLWPRYLNVIGRLYYRL